MPSRGSKRNIESTNPLSKKPKTARKGRTPLSKKPQTLGPARKGTNPVSKKPKTPGTGKRKPGQSSINATRKRRKTIKSDEDHEDNDDNDDDKDKEQYTDDTPKDENMKKFTKYIKDLEKRLKEQPDNKSIELDISEAKAAKKFLQNTNSNIDIRAAMNKKIDKLKTDIKDKNTFLEIIFGSTRASSDESQVAIKLIREKIKTHTNRLATGDDDTWYNDCKRLQDSVCQHLKKNYKQAYINLTTPLYKYLSLESFRDSIVYTNLFNEFYEFIESGDQTTYAENIAYAKRHVVISDSVWVIFMNTGLWRQLFNDGHTMLRLYDILGDINSIAQKNAKTNHIQSGSASSIPCPGCSREILKLQQDKITKTIIGSAADHSNPVTHAYSEYTREALVTNLVMICQNCNSAKLNTHYIKFFSWLQNNKTKPLYNLVKTKEGLAEMLPPGFGEKRLEFYTRLIHTTITDGVLTFDQMAKRVDEIKDVYDTSVLLLQRSTKRYVEDIVGAFDLLALTRRLGQGKNTNLYKKTRKSRAHKLVFNKTFKGKV